jgi:hypothetical protein
MAEAGTLELKSAGTLRQAADSTARTLHESGMSSEQAKAEAAVAVAAALRVDARTAPAETRQPAEATAHDIEDSVARHSTESVDRAIARTKDILQIASYALPFARDIFRVLGL